VREYSRGMKQKLGLVAALQHDPPFVILDEPTGGLDPVMQARLLDWLAERSRAGRTVFFSSHVLSEVEQLCDRVAMVRDGDLLLVRDVGDLPLGSWRMVRVVLTEPAPAEIYSGVDIDALDIDANTHRFRFTGDPEPVLAVFRDRSIVDLVIEPARLEDLFRALYDPTAKAVV
jgi:ABC-2 type transport system ATP-binding protein